MALSIFKFSLRSDFFNPRCPKTKCRVESTNIKEIQKVPKKITTMVSSLNITKMIYMYKPELICCDEDHGAKALLSQVGQTKR